MLALVSIFLPAATQRSISCGDYQSENLCNLAAQCMWAGRTPMNESEPCRDIAEWRDCSFWQSQELCAAQRVNVLDAQGRDIVREHCIWVKFTATDPRDAFAQVTDGTDSKVSAGAQHGICLEKSEVCRLADGYTSMCCSINHWGLVQTKSIEIDGKTSYMSVVSFKPNEMQFTLMRQQWIINKLSQLSEQYGFDLATVVHFPYVEILNPEISGSEWHNCLDETGFPCRSTCLKVSFTNHDVQKLNQLENLSFLGRFYPAQYVCKPSDPIPDEPPRRLVVDVNRDGLEDWGCQPAFSGDRCIVAEGGLCQGVFLPELLCSGRLKKTHCEFPLQAGQICYWDDDQGICLEQLGVDDQEQSNRWDTARIHPIGKIKHSDEL